MWKADGPVGQAFNSGSQYQIIALNALGEYFTGQVLILRDFPDITSPVIAGYHTDIKRCEQSQ